VTTSPGSWLRRRWDIEFEIYEGVHKTYRGPRTMAADMTVLNVTRDHIEVREVS
jgi:hypothetical protein